MFQACLGPVLSPLTFQKSHEHSMGIAYHHSLSLLKDKTHFSLQYLTWILHVLGLGAQHVRGREEGHTRTWERPLSPV